jgi:serine phosphatase RsbU (regulator of sigma subunit)
LKSRIFITALLLLIIFGASAQQGKVDSLLQIKVPVTDSLKADYYNELSYFYCVISTDSSLKYASIAAGVSEKSKYLTGLAKAYINTGRVYYYQDNWALALDWDLKGLKVYEKLGDKKGIADSYRNIANVFLNQNQLAKSTEYYHKGYEIYLQIGDKKGIANCIRGKAANYSETGNLDSADVLLRQAWKLYEEIGDVKNQSTCISALGKVFQDREMNDSALAYYAKALVMKEKMGDKKGVAIIHLNTGEVLISKKKYSLAEKSLLKAESVASDIKSLDIQSKCYGLLAEIYATNKSFEKAYLYHVKYKLTGDSLFSKSQTQKQTELEMQFAFEKERELANAEQAKIDAVKAEEIKQATFMRNISFAGLGLAFAFIVLIYINYRNKKKANALLTKQKLEIEQKNQILNQQNEEIKSQRDELETQSKFLMKQGDKIAKQHEKIREQMDIVNHQKKEIMDSIHYAKRIQMAILPPNEFINNYLKEYFILYMPKDVVSGDFYWFDHVGDTLLFAAVDCTGHGVPGAFMSIVGSNGLNMAVRVHKTRKPSVILDHLDDSVVETLRQSDKTDIKDGMDIALCALNTQLNTLEFSGANNPLYIIRKKENIVSGEGQLTQPCLENEKLAMFEIKGDKQPIGAVENRRKFKNYSISTMPGDTYFLFSDGFADQFGGDTPGGKKYKYSRMKEFFLNIQNEPMEVQRRMAEEEFHNWKGNLEQVDDILIIGIRI